MNARRGIRSFLPAGLLAGLLLGAHTGAMLHAYGHDYGAPQAKICKTCIGFDQLAAGVAVTAGDGVLEVRRPAPPRHRILPQRSAHAPIARQRGPPLAKS